MPINAPPEYFKAELRFQSAKTKDEKMLALEEMMRWLPHHHGSEKMHAELKSRLAKLRKETTAKKGSRTTGITKEGEAQVCIFGLTKSGKSTLLAALTGAKPAISGHPFTTTKPEVGMMDYKGVKIQIIEIPSTFEHQHLSITRTSDLIIGTIRDDGDKKELHRILAENFIHTDLIFANPFTEPAGKIKEIIWAALGLIVVYTRKTGTSMALKRDSTIKDFALRIHKDFVKNFRFARVYRGGRIFQAGLNYVLKDGDSVELHVK